MQIGSEIKGSAQGLYSGHAIMPPVHTDEEKVQDSFAVGEHIGESTATYQGISPDMLKDARGNSPVESGKERKNPTGSIISTAGTDVCSEKFPVAGDSGPITLLDNSAASVNGPEAFTAEALEAFYLTSGADGNVTLSDKGLELYSAVKAKFMDSVPKAPYGSPTLYMTAGLPGSGKGYIMKKLMGDNPQFVLVDPDEVKKEVVRDTAQRSPGLHTALEGEKMWGSITHKVSSVIANKLMGDALQTGKDIMYDSTMTAPTIDRYWKFAGIARSNGYKVNGILVKVTPPTAEKRAIERAKKPTKISLDNGDTLTIPGRWAPMKFYECEQNLNRNIDEAFKGGLFDRCSVFNNETQGAPAQPLGTYVRKETAQGTFQCIPE